VSWPVTVIVTLAALFVLDRLLRRMEDRGWIHYRRFKPSGNGAANALAEFQEMLQPNSRQVVIVKQERRGERDDDGGPDKDKPKPPPP
jgi:hypothetical protein